MGIKGLVIVGPRAAGKSTLAHELCTKYPIFKLVKGVTTRPRKQDDRTGEWKYATQEKFADYQRKKKLLVETHDRMGSYGIPKANLSRVINTGRIPVLILAPRSLDKMRGFNYFSIFLDASDQVLDERLRGRGVQVDNNLFSQRMKDRLYKKSCSLVIENGEASKALRILARSKPMRDVVSGLHHS